MEKKAAVYCRLSREDEGLDEDAHSESIVNQQKLLCDYAQKNGFCIYCIYVDENYSGLDNCRPAFCRLIEDAQHGRFQTILCKNQSRFTRDMETAEHYLNELFPLWGIRFIGVCDRTDTDDEKNRRMRQINGLVNEWYSEDLSWRASVSGRLPTISHKDSCRRPAAIRFSRVFSFKHPFPRNPALIHIPANGLPQASAGS